MSFCGFQRRLMEAKDARGLNNSQIARACFVERKAVSNWTNGKHLPRADSLYSLCEVLGVSADWLLGLEERH